MDVAQAAFQLTRLNLAWTPTLGSAAVVSFAFRSSSPGGTPEDTSGFVRFTEAQIAATLMALQSWSDVANLTFVRVSDADGYSNDATMLFGSYGSGAPGAAAFAYYPGSTASASSAGDVWLGASIATNANPAVFNYGQFTLVHEIGHAIGLSHPSNYDALDATGIDYGVSASYFEDTRQYSVMSYFSETNSNGRFAIYPSTVYAYPSAPMLDDIAAAQRLYGANLSTRTGDTIYGFNSNADRAWFTASSTTAVVFAVWDAGGYDTLDFSGYSQDQHIDLRQGAFSNVGGLVGNVSIASGAVIEAAIGGRGNDVIFGNSGDNLLTGGGGSDTIDGGLGQDTVVFAGAMADYTIGGGTIQSPPIQGQYAGATVVYSQGTRTVVYNVEFLRFSDQTIAVSALGGSILTGDNLDNIASGTAFNDRVSGLDGDDTLYGLGGSDELFGGRGNDRLFGGAGNDFLYDSSGSNLLDGGEGTDTIQFDTSFGVVVDLRTGVATRSDGTDTLVSIENIVGSLGDDLINGDDNANEIYGRGGKDVLNGFGGNDILRAGSGAGSVLNGGSGDDILFGAGGNDTLDGGDGEDVADYSNYGSFSYSQFSLKIEGGALTVTGPYALSGVDTLRNIEWIKFADHTIRVSEISNVVTGTPDRDVLVGTPGSDLILGLDGNDLLTGGGGSDRLDGGSGFDATIYSGLRLQYAASSTAVSGGPEGGTDTLTSIEEARFVDGVLSFDVNSAAARVMRLYDAALDRLPDQGGLEATSNALSAGALTLQQLANNFVGGAEFQARYGALSNQAFVEQLYRFCLNREGDARGVAAWTEAINAGMSRGEVLVGFSEGQEHRNLTASVLAAGLWTPDPEALTIARLYDATFDRLPDPGGLAAWVAALDGGVSLVSIAANFASSTEFQQRYGTLSNQAFVEQLYRFCLDREGDAGGIQNWVNAINGGLSRAAVLLQFSEGAEHILLTAPSWSGGIQFEGYQPHASVAISVDVVSGPQPSETDLISALQGDGEPEATVGAANLLHVAESTHHMLFLPTADEFVMFAVNLRDDSGQFCAQPQHDIEQVLTAQAEPVLDVLAMPELFALDGFDLHPQQPVGDYWLH